MSKIYFEKQEGDFLISTNSSLLNINLIHQYLSTESYWAQNIPISTVEKAIQNSLCFGVYHHQHQIGFARVLTDNATFAYVADVFIIKSEQGQGLGKLLMKTIHEHPELQGLKRWLLTTKDAHDLYAQFGWQPINDDLKNRLMTINKPNIYKENQ